MFVSLFNTFIYNPLYNGLVLFIDFVPMADVGIAVILLTILVKLLLFPIAQKVARTQVIIKKVQPEIDEIKNKYKDDRTELTRKTLEVYKQNKINPLFGFLIILIQLPIIFGLYWVFYKGGLPNIDTTLLYSFVPIPYNVNMLFLGVVPMAGKSVVLAALAGITQFINMQIIIPKQPKKDPTDKPNFKDDMTRNMHIQMKYMMPILITVMAYVISSAIALYWVTSNIFAIGQELLVRKQLKEE
jgi:YidC/Oxa1 family membrane protein insertase